MHVTWETLMITGAAWGRGTLFACVGSASSRSGCVRSPGGERRSRTASRVWSWPSPSCSSGSAPASWCGRTSSSPRRCVSWLACRLPARCARGRQRARGRRGPRVGLLRAPPRTLVLLVGQVALAVVTVRRATHRPLGARLRRLGRRPRGVPDRRGPLMALAWRSAAAPALGFMRAVRASSERPSAQLARGVRGGT